MYQLALLSVSNYILKIALILEQTIAYFFFTLQSLSVEPNSIWVSLTSLVPFCLLHYCQTHGLETLPVQCSLLFLYWSVGSSVQKGFSHTQATTTSTKPESWRQIYSCTQLVHRKVLPHLFSLFSIYHVLNRQPHCSRKPAANGWCHLRVSNLTTFQHRKKIDRLTCMFSEMLAVWVNLLLWSISSRQQQQKCCWPDLAITWKHVPMKLEIKARL